LDSRDELVFDYVAGAGDDEESWSMGLNPCIMWNNYREILLADESELPNIIDRLLVAGDCSTGVQEETVDTSVVTHFDGLGLTIASYTYVSRHLDCLKSSAVVNMSSCSMEEIIGCPASTLKESERVRAGSITSKACRIIEIDHRKVTRNCWIQDAAARKHPVIEYAPCSTEFVSHHLQAGRNVIFVYESSTSSIALALLLCAVVALFTISEGDESHFQRLETGYVVDDLVGLIEPAVGTAYSRDVFRKYVANITSKAPHIVVRKSILKQVFNVFIHM